MWTASRVYLSRVVASRCQSGVFNRGQSQLVRVGWFKQIHNATQRTLHCSTNQKVAWKHVYWHLKMTAGPVSNVCTEEREAELCELSRGSIADKWRPAACLLFSAVGKVCDTDHNPYAVAANCGSTVYPSGSYVLSASQKPRTDKTPAIFCLLLNMAATMYSEREKAGALQRLYDEFSQRSCTSSLFCRPSGVMWKTSIVGDAKLCLLPD